MGDFPFVNISLFTPRPRLSVSGQSIYSPWS
jgi:hypothetical protein